MIYAIKFTEKNQFQVYVADNPNQPNLNEGKRVSYEELKASGYLVIGAILFSKLNIEMILNSDEERSFRDYYRAAKMAANDIYEEKVYRKNVEVIVYIAELNPTIESNGNFVVKSFLESLGKK